VELSGLINKERVCFAMCDSALSIYKNNISSNNISHATVISLKLELHKITVLNYRLHKVLSELLELPECSTFVRLARKHIEYLIVLSREALLSYHVKCHEVGLPTPNKLLFEDWSDSYMGERMEGTSFTTHFIEMIEKE